MSNLALAFGIMLAVFIGGLEAVLLWMIATGRINLKMLISEGSGAASLSRFQFLVFTFVIAMSFFLVVATDPTGLPDVPAGVFTLLGISGGSYIISKGIQASQGEEGDAPTTDATGSGSATSARTSSLK